jgi:uncharacterized protein (DUF1330 family)
MKQLFATATALVAGIVIGGASVRTLSAETKPPVFMIEDNTVNNPEAFAREFSPLARDSLRAYGGRFLAGGSGVSIDGDPPKGRVVIVQWDSIDQMMIWRRSPEYRSARIIGEKYGQFRVFAVDSAPQ